MKVLNLYFSSTGNTRKVALKIEDVVKRLGHEIDTLRVLGRGMKIDIVNYDFVFMGSPIAR